MTLSIKTSPENAEMANFLLARAIESAKENVEFQKAYSISQSDIHKAEIFRRKLAREMTK